MLMQCSRGKLKSNGFKWALISRNTVPQVLNNPNIGSKVYWEEKGHIMVLTNSWVQTQNVHPRRITCYSSDEKTLD